MTQDSAPAGWYDDPAGGGGRRYWDGRAWTERTQGAAGRDVVQPRPAASSRRDRVPEGHMMLNGRQVPLGQTRPPSSVRSPYSSGDARNRGLIVASAVALGIVLLIVVSSLFATDEGLELGDWAAEGEYAALYTIEVDSRGGTSVDVTWSDGTDEYAETAVGPGWSTDIGATSGEIWMDATANDGRDIPTCRVVDADGTVLTEATASGPGETASCRWDS